MTPEEWDRCADPQRMLEALRGKASGRGQRLFICACCRHLWSAMTHEERKAVEVAERFAEGRADERQMAEARQGITRRSHGPFYADYETWDAVSAALRAGPELPAERAAHALVVAAYWTGPAGYARASIEARYTAREAERVRQAAAVRCIFANPFGPPPNIPGAVLAFDAGAARRLAEVIYDGRRFEDLPVLADCLEEAGLTDAALLGHLRGAGPHVLGCHALDAILVRS
jgi:hypothetical protein